MDVRPTLTFISVPFLTTSSYYPVHPVPILFLSVLFYFPSLFRTYTLSFRLSIFVAIFLRMCYTIGSCLFKQAERTVPTHLPVQRGAYMVTPAHLHHSVVGILKKTHQTAVAADGSKFICCSMLLKRHFPMLISETNPEGISEKWIHTVECLSMGPELSAWCSSHSLKRMFKVDGIAVCPCCLTSQDVRKSDLGNPLCTTCDSVYLEGDLCLT